MEQFEALLSQRAVAQRELEQLANIEALSDAEVRNLVLRTGGNPQAGMNEWSGRLHAVQRFLDAQVAVDTAVAGIRQQQAEVEAAFDRLRQGPVALPGSRANAELADQVRQIEGELPRLRVLLGRVEGGGQDPAPVVDRAKRAQKRLAVVLKGLEGERAVAAMKAAIDRRWIHAHEVVTHLENYETFCRAVDAAVGEAVPAPVIVFPAVNAWRRLLDREEPRLEWPQPEAPPTPVEPAFDGAPARGRLARALGRR